MNEPRHIFLIGFMGAGKSTVARLVSVRLARPAIDLDEVIEQRSGQPVATIFRERGEEAFRDLESEALASLADREPSVVACGGGVVLRSENRGALCSLGRVIYLEVTAGEALARIGDAESRPLLSGPSGTLAATSLLAARESLYRASADAIIDTTGLTPEQVADDVVAIVGRLEQ